MDTLQRFLTFINKESNPSRRSADFGPVPPRQKPDKTSDPTGALAALKFTRQAKRKAERDAKAKKVHQGVMQEVKRKIAPKSDEIPL